MQPEIALGVDREKQIPSYSTTATKADIVSWIAFNHCLFLMRDHIRIMEVAVCFSNPHKTFEPFSTNLWDINTVRLKKKKLFVHITKYANRLQILIRESLLQVEKIFLALLLYTETSQHRISISLSISVSISTLKLPIEISVFCSSFPWNVFLTLLSDPAKKGERFLPWSHGSKLGH